MNFDFYYKQKKNLIEKKLKTLLKPKGFGQLNQAMNYSLLAGGKRFRPVLALMIDDFLRNEFNIKHHRDTLLVALSLELIHTYTLIHDDLPAMDDDDLRRGKPSCHKQYGEATAILAGDALQTKAFELLSKITNPNIGKIIHFLTVACGANGVIGGQEIDLKTEGKKNSKKMLQTIYALKTTALLRASVLLPFFLTPEKKKVETLLKRYADNIGLAFQITDDILDVDGNEKQIGKKKFSDLKKNKSTFVSLLGLHPSKKYTQKLILEAKKSLTQIETLNPLKKQNSFYLKNLADFILNRSK